MERQIEKKTFDDFTLHTTNPARFSAVYMQGIGTGTADNQRIGKRAAAVSWQINLHVRAQGNATFLSQVRILLIRDKQNIAEIPPLVDVNKGILDGVEVHSLRNKANFSRYDIIRDQIISIPPLTEAGSQKAFTWFIRPKGRRADLQWLNSTAAGSGGVDRGGIGSWYMFVIFDTTDLLAAPTVAADIRLRFTDA